MQELIYDEQNKREKMCNHAVHQFLRERQSEQTTILAEKEKKR